MDEDEDEDVERILLHELEDEEVQKTHDHENSPL